ncbi:MAG: futalosine hydrolase [Nitrospirota bacterium]
MNLKRNKIIGLISSVPLEGNFFTRRLKYTGKAINKQTGIFTGRLSGKDVVYSISGIGKTNASHATTLLIHNFAPELIINFGVGGAYPYSGLGIGDIAIAEKEIYGDEGVFDKKGLHGVDFIGIPFLKKGRRIYFNEFPFHKGLVRKVAKAVEASLVPQPAVTHLPKRDKRMANTSSGIFVTVSTCTGTRERAIELGKKFNAICENMEGAAVAHICCEYDIPCIEIRGISNIVEDRDTGKWDIRLASENCQKALLGLLNLL